MTKDKSSPGSTIRGLTKEDYEEVRRHARLMERENRERYGKTTWKEPLHDLRVKAKLSQSQLADAAGISARSLQEYEQGRNNVNGMAITTAVRIAAALGCEVRDLIREAKVVDRDVCREVYRRRSLEAQGAGKSNCYLCAKTKGRAKNWYKYPETVVVTDKLTGDIEPDDCKLVCREHYLLTHKR